MPIKSKQEQKKQRTRTPNSKYIFIFLFFAILAFAAWTIYLEVNTVFTKRLLEGKQQYIASLQQEIIDFSKIQ